ncbi:MAG: DUF3048 domain-containing protein [Anaerolineae bacterium]|nr:DUF3048 domain-containing protein [Anaerolineae bacterium]
MKRTILALALLAALTVSPGATRADGVRPAAQEGPATPTPLPSPIILPPITPTPDGTPTATPVGGALPALEPLPADVNPLTGLVMANPARLNRRPLLVKISNYPPLVRPQHGINRADHVWEHIVEGGGTRFTAVYLTEDLQRIGSTRSARLVDLYLTPIYRGLLAYSGGSIGTMQQMRAQPWFGDRTFSLEEGDDCPMFCRYEIEGVDFWHTMFASAAAIRESAAALEIDERVDLRGLTFSAEPPPGGTPYSSIEISYPGTNNYWFYSPYAGKHYRWSEGQEHHDALGDAQVAYTNVALIYANHVEDRNVVEDEVGGASYAVDIQLEGEGPAVVFRSGQRYDGRWVRPAPEGMIRLVDAAGNDIPLAPGTTWFHLLPLDHTALWVN